MYTISKNGQIIKDFDFFFDAWLYIKLERTTSTLVIGPDGQWLVDSSNN